MGQKETKSGDSKIVQEILPQTLNIENSQFFIDCVDCKNITKGKVRIRCSNCKFEGFEIKNGPTCFDELLLPNKVNGICAACDDLSYGEFYFKCGNEKEGKVCKSENVTLLNISLANDDITECPFCVEDLKKEDLLINFGCNTKMCLTCFKSHSKVQLKSYKFSLDEETGYYTVKCPDPKCQNLLKNIVIFKYLDKEDYISYKKLGLDENFKKSDVFAQCPLGNCENPSILISNSRIKYVKCTNCKVIINI